MNEKHPLKHTNSTHTIQLEDAMQQTIRLEYGVTELRRLYQKNAGIALGLALIIHLFFLGGYFLITAFFAGDVPRERVIYIDVTKLGPPPTMRNSTAVPAVSVASSTRPSEGRPIPVPEAEISPDATIASQEELARNVGPDLGIDGGDVVFEGEVKVDEDLPPADFKPVEKYPVPLTTVAPEYPEIARRAGIEGTVWVKIWVTKEGKVKTAQVVKSDAEIFNQAAIDAAMQWRFTPAVMNNGPVAVWVSIPFKFKLNQIR